MNILLINHYAGSPLHGMEYRPFYLARAWQKQGHRVRVVAATFSHLRARQPRSAAKVFFESVEGLDYCWLPTPPYSGNSAGRIRNMMSFVLSLRRCSCEITKDFAPDLVITGSTYLLDFAAARPIAKRHGARLVHEVRDLWPLSLVELGNMPQWHPFIAAMQLAERYAYSRADKVVSTLSKAEEHMLAHGLAPGKFAYVPNGLDPADWDEEGSPLPIEASAKIDSFRARFPFLVGYAGGHGLSNALDALLGAAAQLSDAAGFVLVGHGPEKARLKRKALDAGLRNVMFLDPVRKECVPALLRQMDALYIGWFKRRSLYRFGISPNKLMDYMMAAKPVVHAVEAGNDLVSESACGLSVPPEDAAAIAKAVTQLMSTSVQDRAAMGERGRNYLLHHHSYDVLAARFLKEVAT